MRKKIGFIDKMRIFYHWMKQHRRCGLITTCSKCDSTRLERTDSETRNEGEATIYCAIYKCLDCHAIGANKEVWY